MKPPLQLIGRQMILEEGGDKVKLVFLKVNMSYITIKSYQVKSLLIFKMNKTHNEWKGCDTSKKKAKSQQTQGASS